VRSRPDVIIVLTDQHRADVSRREDFPLDTTPFTDELARRGVWFDRAYTTSPLCCPARTSLLTGRWPSAHRVVQNPAQDQAVFHTDLFGVAREAGYATAHVGKNHTYLRPQDVDHFVDYLHQGRVGGSTDPDEAAFEEWLDGLNFHHAEEPAPFPVELQNPYRIVSDTIAWADSVPDDQPLLAVVSFPEPHNPYQAPEPYYSMFPPEDLPPLVAGKESLEDLPFAWRYLHGIGEAAFADYDDVVDRARSNYLGMLRLVDDQVRRLHEHLGRTRGADGRRPQVMALTADHGDFVGEYGLLRKGAEISDILARVPLVVAGDDIRSPRDPEDRGARGAHTAHVSIADLLPTLCEAMGVATPPGVQGRSLWQLLTGADFPHEEFASAYVEQGMGGLPYGPEDVTDDRRPGLFHDRPGGEARFDELNAVTQSGRRRKIRSGDWTLYADVVGGFRLYDVVADPLELHDRWGDPDLGAVREELLRALAVWQMRAEDPLPVVPRGYPAKSDPRGYVAT
jgi:arylsulfatase A-like enzyme